MTDGRCHLSCSTVCAQWRKHFARTIYRPACPSSYHQLPPQSQTSRPSAQSAHQNSIYHIQIVSRTERWPCALRLARLSFINGVLLDAWQHPTRMLNIQTGFRCAVCEIQSTRKSANDSSDERLCVRCLSVHVCVSVCIDLRKVAAHTGAAQARARACYLIPFSGMGGRLWRACVHSKCCENINWNWDEARG